MTIGHRVSTVAIAIAAMPSPRPSVPRPSFEVAFTLTPNSEMPIASAIFFCIAGMCGAIFGDSAMIVASTFTTRALRSVSNAVTRRKISRLLMPRMDSSVFGKWWPMSPAQIDRAASSFDQNPSGRDVPQTNPALDVGVEATAGDVSHVERGTPEHATFAHAVDHFLKQGQIPINHLTSLGEPDRDDGFAQFGAFADPEVFAVQTRVFAFLDTPHFVAHGIVNHTYDDLPFETQGDRNAKVRDTIKIIHGAVERIDHPLVIARLVADDSLFAVERVVRKLFEQQICNQLLHAHVDLELDVVRLDRRDAKRAMKIFPEHVAGGARRVLGGVEVMFHQEVEWLSLLPLYSQPLNIKKTGRRN